MLIQAFVPSGDDEYELIAKEDAKATEEVNQYIEDLGKSNPKLATLMRNLWDGIRRDPEDYRDKNVSNLLEDMAQETKYEVVQDFSEKWQVDEEELEYVVANYSSKKERQNGEKELRDSADYQAYREKTEKPVPKLKYWKTVRSDLEKVMVNEILPLQWR